MAQPILIGRPEIVRRRAERLGLRFRPGTDVELVDPSSDPRYDDYWGAYHRLMERRGVTVPTARNLVRTSPTLIAALMVHLGDADAMIAGAYGRFRTHFNHVRDVIGLREGSKHMAALSLLVMPTRSLFIADTYVNQDPDAETIAEITLLAADAVLRFGIQPQGGAAVALAVRQLRPSVGAQDGRGGGDAAPARARARGRRRDARRRRARSGDPPDRVPELDG